MAPNPLHLGVALEGAGWHPAAWREPNSRPAELFGPGYWTDLVATAQRGLLDFVTFDDSLAVPGPRHGQDDGAVDQVRTRIDAHLIVSRVAPVTRHIGLIPTVTTTHTEPFHVPTRRFIDRDKLHYIDFEGRFFNVRGALDHAAPAAGPARGDRARACPADL